MNVNVSAADLIQAERILRIETPLGADVLLPERFEMREEVSGLFEISIAVRSKKIDLKADEIVGKLVDISLETGPDGSGAVRRTWNGLVVELVEGPHVTRGLRSYHLMIRPEHWLLTQKSDCRIWLDKTSVEVAQILMGEHGLASPVTSGIIEVPPANHYSVQWNETDWDYLTRRLEEDGIFFWFEHEGGEMGSVAATHTLHIASHESGYVTGPETDVRFAMGSTDRNHISKFEKRFRFIPGKRAGADWNFETPGGVPMGETPSVVTLPKNGGYELYEYPAIKGYGSGARASEEIKSDMVEARSKLRMMAAEADHERNEGNSTVRTLAPGRRFKPYDVANPGNVFEEHAIVGILHKAQDRSYETNEGEPDYRNTFMAVPSRVPATPHRSTRRPSIDGSQIALVAGPEGEEIHPDEYGRIKVWFPWDRRAKKDGSDTCWMRVSQPWGGGKWGSQVIPRIGMEVTVSYLDGDPDRPLITGVVPNAKNKVPYDLPGHKTKMVFRSDSHKGQGYNEISYEDEAGKENMFFHAQKDQTFKVLNNRAKRVENNQVESVGNNKNIDVTSNHQEKIGGSMNLSIGGGGGSVLFGSLAGLIGGSGGSMQDAVKAVGNPLISTIAGGMQEAGVAAEGLSLGGNKAFETAGEHFTEAGKSQQGAAEKIGSILSKVMPLSGIMNTIVEKIKSDTIGIMRTEQIGVMKNTMVGHTQKTSVGKYKKTVVGDEYVIEVGKSKMIMRKDGTVIIKGVKFHFTASGSFVQEGKVIDLN